MSGNTDNADSLQVAIIAASTLFTGMRDDEYTAMHELISAQDKYGPDVTGKVMLAWIDILLTGMQEQGCKIPGLDEPLTWCCADCGDPQTADEVPPEIRWAGWMIASRANDDLEQAKALISSIESNEQYTEYIAAVLHVCCSSVKELCRPSQSDDASS